MAFVDKHVCVRCPDGSEHWHAHDVQCHSDLVKPPVCGGVHSYGGYDIYGIGYDAENQNEIERLFLKVKASTVFIPPIQMILDKHNDEYRECEYVGFYMPHRKSPL